MMASLRAEMRKLWTVRSTYLILGFILLIMIFFAFYVEGLKAGPSVSEPGKLASEVTSAISAVALFGSIIAVLLVTHEYRYNTINYTLTSSNSRTKVFLAKFITISLFAIAFSLVVGALSPTLTYLGLSLRGLHLVHQDFPIWNLVWRTVFMGWGMAMYALILSSIIRVQVGAIVAMFMAVPVESILGLLLKKNMAYLPFTALDSVIHTTSDAVLISYRKAATIAITYIIVGGIVAWQLFLRRDAG